ncbi:hypothetical protein [Leptothermofonsia sp. ETS-13]|uniref:hypothetical protein n=1 Tax=Leptothermofonsia sp. ETS-13 TaxID=3035696 RepID=UPI003BA28664
MNSKQIEKAIQKNAKKVIAESGISSSRAGNKELSHLATKLSSQSIKSLETAQILGERLGRKIVELSQSANKQHLDRGIIRTLVVTKAVPSVDDLPAEVRADATVSKVSQASKAPMSVKPSSPQKVEPVVQPADEPDAEDNAPAIQVEPEDDRVSETDAIGVVEEAAEDDAPTTQVEPEDDQVSETDAIGVVEEAATEDDAPTTQVEPEDDQVSETDAIGVVEEAATEQEEEEVSEPTEEPMEAMPEEEDAATIESDVVAGTAVAEEQDTEDDTAIVASDAVDELLTEEELDTEEEPATEAV